VVRLPFPRETKWTPADLKLSDRGAGTVGGLHFGRFGEVKRTKINDEVLDAVHSNQLQVVIGRLQNRVGE